MERVDLFEDFEQAGLARRRRLFQTESARVAPWPVASGREQRVLFGDLRGRLWVWKEGRAATLPSRNCTILGPKELFLQQDAVPVLIDVDGRELLIVGASIVGNPQSIDDPQVPATGALQETLSRLRKSGTPCNPHLFLLPGSSLEEVSAELARHRASFAVLGLPWDAMGANEHGWWVPKNDTALGFLLQRTAGLCFNFGWQPPSVRGAPGSDVEFALSFPFLLRHEEAATDFVLHAPVLPDRYPRALELMAAAGLPMAFFVHPEYRREGPGALDADRWIGAVEELRRRHGGVFVTENQMAKAIAVTLTSEVRVVRTSSGELRLEANASAVPPWADEYRRTLAVERSFGWTGIAVEPNRIFFEQLRRNRRCRVENACIAERSGTVDFIEASWFGRIQDHFREGLPERDHRQDPYLTHDIDGSPAKVVRMPALSLEDLLRRHRAPRRIDFMSIDAEFSEWFILKSFPFHRFEVLALCTRSKFRHAGTLVDGKHAEDIRRVLCDLGYFYDREHSRHLEYDFFVHPNVIEHPLPDPAVRGGP